MKDVDFEELRLLFGLPIDASAVVALLAKYPDHRITRPSDGAQYVVFKSLGFDLLFQPPTGLQGGRTKSLRVLFRIFLYRDGKDKHKAFAVPPFGIDFSDRREVLLQKLGEPYASSSKDEQGNPGWEKWRLEEWTIHTMYDRTTMTSQVFSIGKADLES